MKLLILLPLLSVIEAFSFLISASNAFIFFFHVHLSIFIFPNVSQAFLVVF